MIAKQNSTIERCTACLEDLYTRIAQRFVRPEVRDRANRYLAGLLGEVRRKNGWQMAEGMGEDRPRGVQHLLNDACWDADAVRDDLREYVIEHLGDRDSGVLIVDETGFLKKGEKSVGVARQYTGTAGKKENAQVGVFLCYASDEGTAFIDRELYLPREWTDEPDRLREAGVPEEVGFATKGELAKTMLGRAFEAGVPARWVVGDTVYGIARGLKGFLEGRGCSYVLAVPETKGIYHEGRQRQAKTIARGLPEEAWIRRASAGEGSKGERLYEWACVPLADTDAAADEENEAEASSCTGRWLLVRRQIDDPRGLAYYLCYGPLQTEVHELIRIAGSRWRIEDGFKEAKSEIGLNEYEVRKWDGWYRHTTLCLLAHAYLAVLRSVAEREEAAGTDTSKGGTSDRICIPS
jgi:SRSO17 transposase